jgi:hypothetical protein
MSLISINENPFGTFFEIISKFSGVDQSSEEKQDEGALEGGASEVRSFCFHAGVHMLQSSAQAHWLPLEHSLHQPALHNVRSLCTGLKSKLHALKQAGAG